MWIWIAVGLGSFAFVSLLIGLVFARVLRSLRDASELLETGAWVTCTADNLDAAPTRVEHGARLGNRLSPAAARPLEHTGPETTR